MEAARQKALVRVAAARRKEEKEKGKEGASLWPLRSSRRVRLRGR